MGRWSCALNSVGILRSTITVQMLQRKDISFLQSLTLTITETTILISVGIALLACISRSFCYASHPYSNCWLRDDEKLRSGHAFSSFKSKNKIFTIKSDGDVFTHCCANCVVNLAFVDKHSSSCHCYVPNSCAADFIHHHSSIHIQPIRTDSRVAISWTVESGDLSLADCCFARN